MTSPVDAVVGIETMIYRGMEEQSFDRLSTRFCNGGAR